MAVGEQKGVPGAVVDRVRGVASNAVALKASEPVGKKGTAIE